MKSRRRHGFTIVEILFATTCSVMVMGGVFGLFIILTRLFNEGSLQMRLQSQARYGIERITSHVRATEFLSLQSNGDRIDMTIPITNLRADVSSSATYLPVDSVSLLPYSGVLTIGGENISFAGTTAPGDAQHPSVLSCTRGYGGTSAASHDDDDVLYLKPIYYLNGNRLYVNMTGTPSTATDEVVISNVEKISGVNLFQYFPVGTSSYKSDRVQIAFRCFLDRDADHIRDRNEPGVDFSVELFLRNK